MKKLISVISVMLLVIGLSATIVQAQASGSGKIQYNAWLKPIQMMMLFASITLRLKFIMIRLLSQRRLRMAINMLTRIHTP